MTHDALCYRSHDQPLGRDPFCQCDALRACEQRVRDEERGWEGAVVIARAGYEDGYAAALDAAREAVAATFTGWCDDYMNCTDYEHVCGSRRGIIAAIDALREQEK